VNGSVVRLAFCHIATKRCRTIHDPIRFEGVSTRTLVNVDRPFLRSSQIVGLLNAVVSLGLNIALAWALVVVVGGHAGEGALLLVGVLSSKGLLALGLSSYTTFTRRQLQLQLRQSLKSHFSVPVRDGAQSRGDLATAIESVSAVPTLEALKIASRVVLVGVVIVFLCAGWINVVIILGLMAASVPLYIHAGRKSEVAGELYAQRRQSLETRQLELLRHSVELRSLGALTYAGQEVDALSAREHEAAASAISVTMKSSLITEFLSGVSIGLVAMVVGFGLLSGHISLFRALTSVLVTSEIFLHIRRFGQEFHREQDALAARSALQFSPSPRQSIPIAHVCAVSEVRVFEDSTALSFTVSAGDRILIKGASGVGKTSLLDAMLGWMIPFSGSVSFSPERCALVRASTSLFPGTLRENLTLGASIEDAALQSTLKELGLIERVHNLNENLTANALGLSDGERVRLLIARALLCDAQILVLDDVGGLLDEACKNLVRTVLAEKDTLTIIEAGVDEGIISPTLTIDVRRG